MDVVAKLIVCDLAGSERASRTQTSGAKIGVGLEMGLKGGEIRGTVHLAKPARISFIPEPELSFNKHRRDQKWLLCFS